MLDNIIKAKTLLYNRNDKNQDFIKDEKQIIKCNLCFSIINKHDISNEFAAMEFEYNYIVDLNDNEVDEKDRVLYFCFQCCDNCFICECGKVYDDGDEIYYLLKNYKKLDKCITCRLEEKEESHNEMEKILDSIGCGDNYDDFIKFIRFLYEHKEDFFNYIKYKNEFHAFLHNKNNNKDIKMKSINIKESDEYKDLEKIKEQNSSLVKNNKILESENKEINRKLDNIGINNKVDIPDIENSENNVDSKINEVLEKQKEIIKKEYEDIIKNIKEEHKKAIEDLNQKIKNKSKNKINKEDKNTLEYLYKGFTIYDNSQIKWKQIAGNFTYNKFKLLYEFNEAIKEDKNVNQDTYNEVIEYLNDKAVLNSYGKIKKLSPYYKNKLKRVSEIYFMFKDKLINVNINTGFISSLSKEQFKMFINILNNELNKDDNINTNINVNINNNRENKSILKKCNNFGYGCDNYVTNR